MNGPILVFGARGQVGRELVALATARRIPIVGLSRAEANITDESAVRVAIDVHRPLAVVNVAGFSAVSRAEREPEAAAAANSTGPAILAAACSDAAVPFVHLSSAYVFDGTKKAAYVETDKAGPVDVYGRTMADGEAKVREAAKRHVILRSSWIYSVYGRNFLRTTLRLAAERDELRMVADQFGCPTATIDLAEAILVVVRKMSEKASIAGTFHFAGIGRTSWHGFAEEIVRRQAFFTGRTPKVTAITSAEYPSAAKRPANCELDSSKFYSTFGFRARPWQERVGEVVAQLLAKTRAAEAKPAEAKNGEANAKAAEAKTPEPKAPEPKPADAKPSDKKTSEAAS
ncbi:MAG: dTDP-4-dehydrorhamnose reductase [Bradyrhizobiaceae bacterium]|nr:dTDP-4-dehydrorhamnose reductase [Bradyrhizobiaceae bacterium]